MSDENSNTIEESTKLTEERIKQLQSAQELKTRLVHDEINGVVYEQPDEVEVMPGVSIRKKLVDEAVSNAPMDAVPTRVKTAREELRRDIEASSKFLAEMQERRLTPYNPSEKYVSFDAMPGPLQRIIKAYTAAVEANHELKEAMAELQKTVQSI